MIHPLNCNYAFAETFVDELARSGLKHACICPGSRSTPLAISFAKNSKIKLSIHIDERSAAYFATGMNRYLNEPVVIVSTSGTAAANFYPAVIEAHFSHLPLIVVTADRPPEFWDWGANQTINQTRIYGVYAKWSVNVASPKVTENLLRYIREIACRAVSTALQSPAGPVHLNFPFGEPLVPEAVAEDILVKISQESWEGRQTGTPHTSVELGSPTLAQHQMEVVGRSLAGLRKGVIVCGPQDDPAFPESISKLACHLGYPILADPLSQVRCGMHSRDMIVDGYDTFLRSEKLTNKLAPEVIMRFGATPRSKPLLNYLQSHHRARQILVQEGDWHDPLYRATDMLQTNPNSFVLELLRIADATPDREWYRLWAALTEKCRDTLRSELGRIQELFEGKIFSELARILPSKATLFVGNSMPVRDLDAFYPTTTQEVRFLCNRGASGIDGVLSAAIGAACVSRDPTVVVIGDLSFYHDMNGLLAAKRYHPNATIVLLNNNGGGVFSFLPQHQYPEFFEEYFGTPHGLTFQSAAALYGLRHRVAKSWQDFGTFVSESVKSSETSIVEVITDRERNVKLHNDVWSTVLKAVESVLD